MIDTEQVRQEERKAIGEYLQKELSWHCNTRDIAEITESLLKGEFPTWNGNEEVRISPERVREVNQMLWGR